MLDFDVAGRVLLVTGGASGIGRAVALFAADQGMFVGIVDLDDKAADTVAEIVSRGGRAIHQVADVRDFESISRAVTVIEKDLGPIHGAVTCAGISRPARAEDMTADEWTSVMEINVTGTFNVAKAAGARMLEHGRGSIVMVGSTDSLGGHTLRANYSASKHAVVGLMRALAIDWSARGVRVNAIAPGVVDTPLLRKNNSEQVIRDTFNSRIPMARMAVPDEPAKAALFLLSDASSYVSGAVLPVDGGLSSGYFTKVELDD